MKADAGIEARVIPGEAEAGLSLEGALFHARRGLRSVRLPRYRRSSTELSVRRGSERFLQSLNAGSVELTERLVENDPPNDEDLSRVFKECYHRISEGYAYLAGAASSLPDRLVGTAGTVTTVVAVLLGLEPYDPARVEGYSLPLGDVADLLAKLSAIPAAERLRLPGMQAGREDVIVAGMLIILTAMEQGGYREMTVTEGSLLEGLLLEAAGTV